MAAISGNVLVHKIRLDSNMIVIHCCDSRSTIVITIALFTIMIVVDMVFEQIMAVYRTYFMLPIVWLYEHCNPDFPCTLKCNIFSGALR